MEQQKTNHRAQVLSLSSSSGSDSSTSTSNTDALDHAEFEVQVNSGKKKQRVEYVLPVGFLDPTSPVSRVSVKEERVDDAKRSENSKQDTITTFTLPPSCKQFWKAGDYEGGGGGGDKFSDDDMDHLRVHPKFLHSNATSHKWALGAFAELLDNALDESCNGATYVNVDVLDNKKDKSKMVMVQDNGGGMTPEKMRQCMSLGYSAKSKIGNTIGQYGNGFKTSTMRLGADVVVFSRCQDKRGGRSTQTIGLLSFSFLRGTGKEDIVVPMIDYERIGGGAEWKKLVKSNSDIWQRNLETIVQWSPYESEEDLLRQFNFLSKQGTRIIIYNLWENEEGTPELDFESDKHDIKIRADNKDDLKRIDTLKVYPSCVHFLTYRHSLRSYAAILYQKFPPGFKIILRGKNVDHYDIVNDLIHVNEVTYRPSLYADTKDLNLTAKVTLGFIKDAKHHIDIQGFNVYHKNRLIKPFWRVWSPAGSDGRGVIGVLEANFVEPAHDKQGFERTILLSRLEARLQYFQKTYWSSKCHLIGYSQRRGVKRSESDEPKNEERDVERSESDSPKNEGKSNQKSSKKRNHSNYGSKHESPPVSVIVNEIPRSAERAVQKSMSRCKRPSPLRMVPDQSEDEPEATHDNADKLKQENSGLKLSLKNALQDLESERNANKLLENQLEDAKKMMYKMDKEQEQFVSAFSEERGRRQLEEETLKAQLKDASETIKALLNKVKMLEGGRHD